MFHKQFSPLVLCLGLTLAMLAVYSNHFENGFHFDDIHTITNNPYIQDLRYVPRFFTDGNLFSTVPGAASYRPLVSASLALDYWLGGGRKPFWFHLSTFLWFLLQLVLMFFLFRRLMDAADPHPSNLWTALLATACYGLHPAGAETVNYIIQRGDLYDTVGLVASLLWFIAYPAQRKRGFYLLPAIAAYLSKAPALIYPLILLAYVFLFEQDADRKKWMAAIRTTLPALLVTGAAAILTAKMTPPTFSGGASSAALYRLTQPWAAVHYFKSFFLPTELSVDNGWTYVPSPFSGRALAGYLFVIGLLAVAIRCSRDRETRPIAFGILWFVVFLLPTSLMPLADVTNDHRMFLPFVGLALAVGWSLRLFLWRKANRLWLRAAMAGLVVVLTAAAAATHERNNIWRTDESLWKDASAKNPNNGRALANYGHAFLVRGDSASALTWLERAETLRPDDSALEIDLALACIGLGRKDAARHFEAAEMLDPSGAQAYCYYGHWLKDQGRLEQSQTQLEAAIRLSPEYLEARNLLAEVVAQRGVSANPSMAHATPEALLNQSAEYCNTGRYPECLDAANRALKLRPGWAEAYGNMAAALLSMQRWDEGIHAARQALAIKPDYQAAKDNLQWALKQKGNR